MEDKYILREILNKDCKTKIYTEHYGKEVTIPILLEDEFLALEIECGMIVMGETLRIFYDGDTVDVTCTDGLVTLEKIK